MADVRSAIRMFESASEYMRVSGLSAELEWQRRVTTEQLTESTFLREAAWVILCSGFRESVVRGIFDHISLCFCDWSSAREILDSFPACLIAAEASFRGRRKLSAIVQAAKIVDAHGFDSLREEFERDPIATLLQFPYIGPITSLHLAKNLGVDTVKPDRHLVRAAAAFGFSGPTELCVALAQESGEPVKVVDLVIWRYLADCHDALAGFMQTTRGCSPRVTPSGG